jgi:hypothetical protein
VTAWWRSAAPTWEANGWSVELRDDELADIHRGDAILLRAVRAVVRDHGWNTVPAVVTAVDSSATSLRVTLLHEGFGAEVTSTLTTEVAGDDLRISWDAENLRAFSTCRAGLVVLHPPSEAGRAVTVTHPDGGVEQTALPTRISPHQPIMDIRALEIDGGPTLRFTGDVFEMEDQRNWSDASFKTYSRPLALPYPYALDAGERIRQSLTVTARRAAEVDVVMSHEIVLAEGGPFPLIGVESSTAPDPGRECSDGVFRVVELDLMTPTWPAALRRAAADGLPLDVRLVIGDDTTALTDAAAALRGLPVVAVTPFDRAQHVSDERTVTATRTALAAAGVEAPLRGGARSHFTELNREQHRIPDEVDGISFTIAPLFHSLDTEQLVESLPMQRLIAAQAVEIAGPHDVHIGPVALRPRFNNVAPSAEPAPMRADLSEGYGAHFTGGSDERQNAFEIGAWTIASAAALAIPGVASLSWFETWGPRGLQAADGTRTPAADAINTLSSLAGGTLLSGASPDGLLWAIGSRDGEDEVVLAANLDRRPRRTVVDIPGCPPVERILPAGSWVRMTVDH